MDFRKIGYLVVLIPSLLSAQGIEDAELSPSDPSTAEKAELLQRLKTEVEPNLLPADAKRIRQNIMRLGSYNSKWSQEAKDFLVENAPLVELFLFDYARIENPRLNQKIIETLLAMPNYQEPRGPLYFSDHLLRNNEGHKAYLSLVQRIVSQNPSLFEDYFSWMFSSQAQALSFSERINFLQAACKSGANFSLDLRSQIDEWSERYRDLWSQIFLEEARRCLQGA